MTTQIRRAKWHFDFGTEWQNRRTLRIGITGSDLTADSGF